MFLALLTLTMLGSAAAQDGALAPDAPGDPDAQLADTDPPASVAPAAGEAAANHSPSAELSRADDAAPSVNFSRERLEQTFTDIWNLELFKSGDTGVRLNQIVIAMTIFVVGVLVSRFVSQLVAGRAQRFSRVHAHAASVVQKITFYLLVVVITLIALPIAGIPITIFTVLGGALAIGVGFGAQNLFNNLISGLIIMFERPIRVGDIVQLDEMEGRVEEIATRRTRVRRTDGVDVLVPNASFLEQNVVNWTLFDSAIRWKVSVGIAYGSPTRRAADLIRRAVDEQQRVLRAPEPTVLFTEFGDNALTFDVYFWTEIQRPMDLRALASDIRFRIDDLFREAGITIAFPQRDVHLNSLSPVQVELVERAGEGS